MGNLLGAREVFLIPSTQPVTPDTAAAAKTLTPSLPPRDCLALPPRWSAHRGFLGSSHSLHLLTRDFPQHRNT